MESCFYDVTIDIPNDRKNRDYSFAYINDFDYEFDKPSYIFEKEGIVKIHSDIEIKGINNVKKQGLNEFQFNILSEEDNLTFLALINDISVKVLLKPPVFKWKFDNGHWHTEHPHEIWHNDFPKIIYLKYPGSSVELSMNPIILDNAYDEYDSFAVIFNKTKSDNLFVCDTRKILSWFGYEEHIRPLYVDFGGSRFHFLSVVTRCFIADNNTQPIEDIGQGLLVFKNSIIGFNNCVADVYYENELIAEKMNVTTGGLKVKVPFRSGKYTVVYFELDEYDDFGFENYRRFGTREFHYVNKRDLTNKSISIIKVIEEKDLSSIFAAKSFSVNEKNIIRNLVVDDKKPNRYYGVLFKGYEKMNVSVCLKNDEMTCATIQFFNTDQGKYDNFVYDVSDKTITKYRAIYNRDSSKRYIHLTEDRYYFGIKIY